MAKQIEAAFPQYTKEQLANPSEELRAEIVNFVTQYISKKAVWFMINNVWANIVLRCIMIMNTIMQMVKIYN